MIAARAARESLEFRAMKRLLIQFLKFSAVGLSAFAIDYALFLVLHLFGMSYLIANLLSYTIANVYNFIMSMKFVFAGRTGQSRLAQAIIFAVLSVIGLGLNEFLLWLLVEFVVPLPVVSKIIATFLVMIFNYVTRKWFFEDHKNNRFEIPEPDVNLENVGEVFWEGGKEVETVLRGEIDIITGKEKL